MREFLIKTAALDTAIKTLQPFISKEETRYYLNGIFFEWKNGDPKINMVATDGHKLCVLQVEMDPATDIEGDIAAIVPTLALKTILQMLKSIQKTDYPLTLRFSPDNMRLWVDTVDQKAELKLIDGTFPDYRRAIPTDKPKFSIGLQKNQATEAVKAVSKHKGTEAMEWQLTDAQSPIKLVGDNKLVVIMPCRTTNAEIDLGAAA